MKNQDLFFMNMALALARRGRGRVHPNPLVGAVLVKNGRVIGQGAHEQFGGPHAEINAFQSVQESPKGSTLYVTLEPCIHFGKTPPCVEAILRQGVRRVVIGTLDANPKVAKQGVQKLKNAGISVTVGVGEAQSKHLNRDFFYWIQTGRPYVILKTAQTLDGKIATSSGQSRWITGAPSRRLAHELRADSDAICVGIHTVLTDNPSLSVRLPKVKVNPWKIVLDHRLRTPVNARLFQEPKDSRVFLVTDRPVTAAGRKKYQGKAEILTAKHWPDLLRQLGRRGIVRLLIEGGAQVQGSALREGVVREVYFFIAPMILGGQHSIGSVAGPDIRSLAQAAQVHRLQARFLGRDLLLHGVLDV